MKSRKRYSSRKIGDSYVRSSVVSRVIAMVPKKNIKLLGMSLISMVIKGKKYPK